MRCELSVKSPGVLCCEACGKCVESDDPPERTHVTCKSPEILQVRKFNCLHRGQTLRSQECKLCGGRTKQVPIYKCALHGQCSLDLWESPGKMRKSGIEYCKGCDDIADPDDNAGRWWHDEGRVTYQSAQRVEANQASVLLNFKHGIGDNLFFTSVLRTLRERRPDLTVDLVVQRHVASLFSGLARNVFTQAPTDGKYELEYTYPFYECDRVWPDARITKWGKCLWEVHGISPTIEQARWSVPQATPYDGLVSQWIAERNLAGRVVLVHHQGTSSREHKDIPTPIIQSLCSSLTNAGYFPIILKRDGASAVAGALDVGRGHVLRPSGDVLEIVALARQAALCIGIDSGPGHLMAASGAPTIQIWIRHHPVHYAQPKSDNVLHLVPHDHEQNIYGDPAICRDWLFANYRLKQYVVLQDALSEAVCLT